MKRTAALISAIVLSALLLFPCCVYAESDSSVTDNTSVSTTAEDKIKEHSPADKPSKAVKALVIIGIFTVTFAASGIATYKMKTRALFSDMDNNNHADN